MLVYTPTLVYKKTVINVVTNTFKLLYLNTL